MTVVCMWRHSGRPWDWTSSCCWTVVQTSKLEKSCNAKYCLFLCKKPKQNAYFYRCSMHFLIKYFKRNFANGSIAVPFLHFQRLFYPKIILKSQGNEHTWHDQKRTNPIENRTSSPTPTQKYKTKEREKKEFKLDTGVSGWNSFGPNVHSILPSFIRATIFWYCICTTLL